MRRLSQLVAVALALVAAEGLLKPQQKPDVLSEEEQDKLRETQGPSERIEIYLAFAQERLDHFEGFRRRPADPSYDNGAYLDSLLGQYIALTDEMKDWIQYQFERKGDMRRGLRALLERAPKQLDQLRATQQSPDTYAPEYAHSLRDAIDDLTDALDGAAKAVAQQDKVFRQMKRDEKTEARMTKERRKEEEKRLKEEKKLRKKERKRSAPAEPDED